MSRVQVLTFKKSLRSGTKEVFFILKKGINLWSLKSDKKEILTLRLTFSILKKENANQCPQSNG